MGQHEAHEQHTVTVTPLADRFFAATKGAGYKPKHRIDDEEYVAYCYRIVRALEARAIENPFILPHVVELQARLAEVANVVIAANADRYKVDPRRGASMMECARLLGISKQSASERRKNGAAALLARIAAAGVARFSEAKRERERMDAATESAVVALDDFRARRSA